MSLGSTVGTATAYGLDDRWVGVRVPVGLKFVHLSILESGSGVHPASYPMDTGGSLPGGKAVGA
jgi:hypothetical protein